MMEPSHLLIWLQHTGSASCTSACNHNGNVIDGSAKVDFKNKLILNPPQNILDADHEDDCYDDDEDTLVASL